MLHWKGDSKGTWRMRLDVNGDMQVHVLVMYARTTERQRPVLSQITLAEWILFWGRNSQGKPPKLREILATYRIFDYMRLLQYRRKGVLKDRYVVRGGNAVLISSLFAYFDGVLRSLRYLKYLSDSAVFVCHILCSFYSMPWTPLRTVTSQ